MTPTVTVVVPTRNRSARLAAAVASIEKQTFDDIEIVVVDDGSEDDTPDVLEKIAAADARVRVIRLATPAGAPVARNRGLEEGRGKFVAFLDDDDRWLPTKLERQVAHLRSHPDTVLVGCHHRIVTDGGGPGLDFRGPTDFAPEDLLWSNLLGTLSNAVVAPDRMDQLVRFDPAFPAYQDWDFYLECNRLGPVAIVPEVLCEYVVHDEPDRLTNQLPKRLAGHELLLRRHGAAMSASCLAYHRARMRVLAATSRGAKIRLAPALLRDTPLVAIRALLTESVNGRIGRLRGDPARPMRHLQRLAASTRRGSHAASRRQR